MATKEKDPNQFTLPLARLSYAKLFKPEGFKGSDENKKFSCNFILDPENKAHAKVIKEIKARFKELQTEKKIKVPSTKLCLKSGEEVDSEGYEGMLYITASNAKKIQTVRRSNGTTYAVSEEEAEQLDILQSGDYVHGVIKLWVQNNEYGKRINASLEIVCHAKRGERFGAARPNADEVLDDIPDEMFEDSEEEDDAMFD